MRHLYKVLFVISLVSTLLLTTGCDLILDVLDEQLSSDLEEVTIEELVSTENFKAGAIEHILEGELNGRGQAVGFHYDGLASKKGEIIQGTRTDENEHGVFEAEVSVEGVKKESNRGRSSFFPDDWSAQDVIDSINEAYDSKEFLTGNTYEGLTDTGVVIRMYLDNKDKIISAFPVY